MIEVDVNIVRAQSPQAALQSRHQRFLAVGRAGFNLRSDVDLVALALQGVTNGALRITAGVALCRVEVIDPMLEGVPHDGLLPRVQAAGAERDIRYLHPGAAERHIAAHLSSALWRLTCSTREGE